MFEYQKYNQYFAQVPGKMEELCAAEFERLGASEVSASYRGVYFVADRKTLYRINYESRLATRVLAPLMSFKCHSPKYLKQTAQQIPWDTFIDMKKGETFAIKASVGDSAQFRHSLFAAMCLKDAIADFFNANYGKRPNVDTKNPDVWFNLRIHRNKARISIDTSGDSLHKRGYRKSSVEAPMQETLAAAIIELSEWEGSKTLWDPMCGSGTLLAEAYMKYCNIPAQYLRTKFGFQKLPDFDKNSWSEVKAEAAEEIRELPEGLIVGSDMNPKSLRATEENLEMLPGSDAVSLQLGKFQDSENFENGVMVVNPPYGIRLDSKENVKVLYKEMGDFLKKSCNGTTAFIYVGDTSIKKSIGLKPSKRYPLVNGSLEGELLKIESYRVTFRKKENESAQ